MSDLSDYEKTRLENIRRNEEFLKTLGIDKPRIVAAPVIKKRKIEKPTREKKEKRKVPPVNVPEALPSRRSRRVAAADARIEAEEENDDDDDDDENQESTEEESIFSYDTMPRESLELDDNEFQIYAILRAWRQRRCKEITEEKGESFEPYMILPNRPICEIIRRKRNDPSWADPSADDDKQYSDLISTWGIGDAKAQDGGFGRQILEFIHEDDNDILGLLQKSRTHGFMVNQTSLS